MWNPVHSSGPWAAAPIASQGVSNGPPSDFESETVGIFWTKPWSLKWALNLPSNSPVLGLYIRSVCEAAVQYGEGIVSDAGQLDYGVYIAQYDGRISR